MRVVLLPAAREDLEELWNFGVERWGEAKADAYLLGIYAAVERLGENPRIAPAAQDLGRRVRRLVCGSHAVFYRVGEDVIDVIRVLHQSADAGRWVE
jgi:toxin ParE1/3/4